MAQPSHQTLRGGLARCLSAAALLLTVTWVAPAAAQEDGNSHNPPETPRVERERGVEQCPNQAPVDRFSLVVDESTAPIPLPNLVDTCGCGHHHGDLQTDAFAIPLQDGRVYVEMDNVFCGGGCTVYQRDSGNLTVPAGGCLDGIHPTAHPAFDDIFVLRSYYEGGGVLNLVRYTPETGPTVLLERSFGPIAGIHVDVVGRQLLLSSPCHLEAGGCPYDQSPDTTVRLYLWSERLGLEQVPLSPPPDGPSERTPAQDLVTTIAGLEGLAEREADATAVRPVPARAAVYALLTAAIEGIHPLETADLTEEEQLAAMGATGGPLLQVEGIYDLEGNLRVVCVRAQIQDRSGSYLERGCRLLEPAEDGSWQEVGLGLAIEPVEP